MAAGGGPWLGPCAFRPRRECRVRWVMVAILLCLLAGGGAARAATPAVPLVRWAGEEFGSHAGAAFVDVVARGFPRAESAEISADLILYSVIERKFYAMSLKDVPAEPPRERIIWTLGTGKYLVRAVRVTAGKRRWVWDGGQGTAFLVKGRTLSNLGLWVLEPEGERGVRVRRKMTANPYADARFGGRVAGVVDGFRGLEQSQPGAPVPVATPVAVATSLPSQGPAPVAEPPPPLSFHSPERTRAVKVRESRDGSQLEVALKQTRIISLFYKLDLFKDNAHASELVQVFKRKDGTFRACFTKRMTRNGNAKGDVIFSFVISNKTLGIKGLRQVGGSFNDPAVIECLANEMENLRFPVERTMLGQLTWDFSVQ